MSNNGDEGDEDDEDGDDDDDDDDSDDAASAVVVSCSRLFNNSTRCRLNLFTTASPWGLWCALRP